jgi:hypothetical protein
VPCMRSRRIGNKPQMAVEAVMIRPYAFRWFGRVRTERVFS